METLKKIISDILQNDNSLMNDLLDEVLTEIPSLSRAVIDEAKFIHDSELNQWIKFATLLTNVRIMGKYRTTTPNDIEETGYYPLKINEKGSLIIEHDPVSMVQKTADNQVKALPGILYGFYIVFSGVTVGDKIEIRDSLSAGSGDVIFTVIAKTTDEIHHFQIPKGMNFTTGIYNDETKTSGTIYATYFYS